MIGFLASHWHWLVIAVFALAFAFTPAFLLRFWRELMIFAGILVAVIFWRDADQARDALRQHDLDDAKAMAAAQSSSRATEQGTSQDLGAVDTTLQLEKRDGQQALADVRDARGRGDLRLRPEFECPKSAAVPGPAAAAGERDAATQGGLSSAHEDFLVRIASEADVVADELTGCQATLRVYLQRFGQVVP